MPGPLALIAEITHRCPLHCVYCSNPLQMRSRTEELPTAAWIDVFEQAANLGALQLDLTGGEPLVRPDLADLIAAARASNLYTNVITSGIGLTPERLDAIVKAGLDHIQLSFQDSCAEPADEIALAAAHQKKLTIAAEIAKYRVAFTMNVVIHRQNLDRLEQMIDLAERLGAHRLEIAHVQYYGWAIENREALLPSRAQVDRSLEIIHAAEERLRSRMRIEYVLPDYYAKFPKACMGGWGRKMMVVQPSGHVLPCHAAGIITGMQFEKVTEKPLDWIWNESPAFRKFRGEDWMPEPCRSCDRRTIDFGGCRCQAFLLAGDAHATDPVCSLAPSNGIVAEIVATANTTAMPSMNSSLHWIHRANP